VSLTILRKQNLNEFISALLPHYRVGGPVKLNSSYAFRDIRDPSKLRLDYPTTILPPKKYLLPVKESLFRFNLSHPQVVQEVEMDSPTVLFGVHTCDLNGIQLLDRVFTRGHIDPNYVKRREQTIIVSIECLRPCDEHSFCKSMGTLTADEGFDIHMIDLGEAYAMDANTEKGENLLKYAKINPASTEDIDRLNSVINAKWGLFSYHLEFDVSELAPLLSVSMKSPLWEELGDRCLACAACTNVCPTCFCFNVKDEIELELIRGERVRNWDSCQLDEFATVAGGHNFRESRALRQRHRFMRKGRYILSTYNHLGCTGCGRCARDCLVDITPVKVFNELYRQRETGGRS